MARVGRRLWREIVGFSAVGLVGVTFDIVTFNVLIAGFHAPKVVASLSGNAFGTFVSYLGNRYWVFRKREHRQSAAEISLFVLVSVVAILITATCVAFNEYVLGLRTLIEANIAQFLVGQGLGSIFRFWAMHTFVFPESRRHTAGEGFGNPDSAAVGEAAAVEAAAHPVGGAGLQTVGQLSEAE
jgi:putative flippase GtrA